MALMSPRVGPCSGVAATGRRGAWRWPGRRWRAPLRGAQTVRRTPGSIGAESATAPSPLFLPDLVALTPYTKRKRRQAGARTGDQVHPTFCLCQLDYDTMSFTSVEWGTRQPDAQKGFLLPLRSRSPRPGPRPSPSLISLAYKRTHSHFAYTACIGRASRRGDRRRAKGRLPMFLFLNLPTLLTRSYARSSEPGDAVPRWRWPFRARVHHK